MALDISDTIIFLDTPLWLRRTRIATRFVKQQLGIEKCGYKSDIKMLRLMFKWANDFEKTRDVFESRLDEYCEKVYIANVRFTRFFNNDCLNVSEQYPYGPCVCL